VRVKGLGLLLALLCLLVTGCGSGGGDDAATGQVGTDGTTTTLPAETTTQPPTTLPATTSSKPAAATTSTTEASVLRRRDARPGGVEELGKPFIGGPPPNGYFECLNGDGVPTGAAAAVTLAPKMVLGEATTVCLSKFTGSANISVQVKRADATLWSAQVSPKPQGEEPFPHVDFFTMPGDPTGTYTVTATQGTLKATATFAVAYAVNQHILVVAESPGRGVASVARGKPVHIGLGGWKAGQRIDLSIHYSASTTSVENAKFITVIPVTVDARGQRVTTLQTRTDDPRGCYVVNTKPAEEPQGALGRLGPSIVAFCLT
jgi:hypothetical protein